MSDVVKIDREGVFRALPIDFGIIEGKDGSQSVGIAINFQILAQYDQGEWLDWQEYNVIADGVFYIISKTGSLLEDQIRRLIECLGWNGDLDQLANRAWTPFRCQITVKRDDYNGKERYRTAWVNAYDSQPGGMYNVDPQRLSALKTQYGAKLRAVAGNVQRNAPRSMAELPAKPGLPPVSKPQVATAMALTTEALSGPPKHGIDENGLPF